MPEIWLPYGSVEVAVNIKAENLAGQIEPELPAMDEESIQQAVSEIEARERVYILSPRPGPASTDVLTRLLKTLTDKGVEPSAVTVATSREHTATLKKQLAETRISITGIEEPTEPAGEIDGVEVKLPRALKESETRILLTDVSFDPLFGFAGGPTDLVRHLGGTLIAEAFRRREGDRPTPGEASGSAVFADRVAGLLNEAVSIEVLPGLASVAGVYVGDPVGAHQAASRGLLAASRVSVKDDLRVALVGSGGSAFDATLAEGLRAVWNVVDVLGDKGVVALVAECAEGLGSEALKRHISGRLDLNGLLQRGEYVDGLEDILYAKTALRRYNLVLVSALPDYYAEMKLGFHPCRKVGDALSYILSSLGSRIKVHIVPHGSATLLSKSEG